MSQEPTPRELGYYFALAQVGLEIVAPAIVGIYLDQWFDTVPWITVALAVFGFTAGLMHLMAILRKKERDESSDKKSSP